MNFRRIQIVGVTLAVAAIGAAGGRAEAASSQQRVAQLGGAWVTIDRTVIARHRALGQLGQLGQFRVFTDRRVIARHRALGRLLDSPADEASGGSSSRSSWEAILIGLVAVGGCALGGLAVIRFGRVRVRGAA